MRKLLPFVLTACCSVACIASPKDDAGSQSGAQNGVQDPPADPQPQPSDPPDDPSDQEGPSGPSCNDPPATTPRGWTKVDLGVFEVAVPPDAVKKSGPPGDNVWMLVAGGKMMGDLQASVETFVHSLDEAEAHEKATYGVIGPDGKPQPSPLTFTRGSHECREDLISTYTDPAGEMTVMHHVMLGGDVLIWTCDVPTADASVCDQFIASMHVK